MEGTAMPQTIDVTGLPPEAVRAVQNLVNVFREQPTAPPAPMYGPPPGETAEEWIARWRAFADSHAPAGVIADDSRESIYGDDGR